MNNCIQTAKDRDHPVIAVEYFYQNGQDELLLRLNERTPSLMGYWVVH